MQPAITTFFYLPLMRQPCTNVTTTAKNLACSGTVTAADFNSTSDVRRKSSISVITEALNKINQIDGVSFIWRGSENKSMGVVAQNIEQVLPELITEDEVGLKSVKYNGLIGVLIEAVKELSAEIEELKSNTRTNE